MTMSSKTREKLFIVIRAGMDLPVTQVELSDDEYMVIMNLARRQSLIPIVYRGLKKMNAPETRLKTLDQECIKSKYRSIQHDDSIKKIKSVLDEERISYIPLKGAVLRNLYPEITLRTSSDIDVLIHEKDVEHAVAKLEDKTDFRKRSQDYHDISMVNSRVHLELHFNIKENDEKIDKLLSKAWEYAIPTSEGSMYEFTPEYQVFHIVAHMSYHFLHGGLGIRPFIDLWLIKRKIVFNTIILEDMLDSCGLLQFYRESCYLSDVWMCDEKPSETTRLFEDFCLSGGVFGNERFRIAGSQRKKRGWRYIGSRVFPPKYQVKEYYKDPNGKEHSLPYYYVKRWRSWLSKDRRTDLRRQINATVTSDKEYQNTADELFARLGF